MIKRRQVAGAGDDVASVDAAQTAHESEKVVVVAFAPKSEKNAKRNLKDFIGLARDQLTVFGADLTWEAWKWDGVCQFTKRSAPPKVKDPTQYLMSKEFIDFAKAYIRYQAGQNSGTRSVSSFRMAALRAVEAALIDRKGVANPRDIDLDTLNQAASLLREQFGPRIAYPRSLKLAELAIFLAAHRLAVVNTRFWRNPIASPKNLHVGIGKEAADAREKLMPDPRALDALGSLFGQGCDVFDRRQHVDIFTTSAAAMLLGAPTRAGEELFKLRIDLEFLGPDKEGVMRYGWRTRSGKNFGWTTKWVPDVWVPVAKEAVRRLKAITEDSRQLALYIEEQMANSKVHPNAPKLFYRHSNCPSVPDDQLLSAEEVCLALGFENPKSLNQNHLSQRDGVYTLESLWKWVLDALPENFPYTDKTEQLKFSEALFCMFSYQLHSSRSASPVRLWKPELSSLGPNLYGDRSIFARHQFLDQEGLPLAIWSHQFRHYLNTLAHEGTGAEYLSPEQIDTWSGRKRRGEDYDHVPGETRAENVARTLRRPDGSYAVIELAPKRAEHLDDKPRSHWRLKLSPPTSIEEKDLGPRGSTHNTLWGRCEHDYLFSPCEKFGDCLHCNEHTCIKGAGKDDRERLERIKALLVQVELEERAAKVSAERGDPGAENWYAEQSLDRQRLEQLVAILQDPDLPNGTKVHMAEPTATSHLHRVLRARAMDALENNTAPEQLIPLLLEAIQSLGVDAPLCVGNCLPGRVETGADQPDV